MPGRLIARTWTHNPTAYAPARYRRACKYQAFLPVPLGELSPQFSAEIAGAVSEAESAIRTLNEGAPSSLAPLARLLLRSESIASSKIEGLQVGVRELARAEAKGDSGQKVGPVATEILGNIDAMELMVEESTEAQAFGLDQIVAIHRSLLARSPNSHIAGRIRTAQNWIGGNDYNPCGAEFVPPPPEHLDGLLADLCTAVNREILPPVAQAALVHAQFETLHPFHDGNGRTGRALIHVVLRRRGVARSYVPPISAVLAAARDQYISGIVGFRGDDVTKWVGQFADAAAKAARLASAYLEAVQRLVERWRGQLAGTESPPRSDATAWLLIELLPGKPVITASVAAALTGRSRPQVHKAIDKLVEAGVLGPLSASKRNRSWEARGLLDLLATLEAGQWPDPASSLTQEAFRS